MESSGNNGWLEKAKNFFRPKTPVSYEPSQIIDDERKKHEACREQVALWGRSLFLNADAAAAKKIGYEGSILEAVYTAPNLESVPPEIRVKGVDPLLKTPSETEVFEYKIGEGDSQVEYAIYKRKDGHHVVLKYKYPDRDIKVRVDTDDKGEFRFDKLSVESEDKNQPVGNSISLYINTFATDGQKEIPMVLKQFARDDNKNAFVATMEYVAIGLDSSAVKLREGQEVKTNAGFTGKYSSESGVVFESNGLLDKPPVTGLTSDGEIFIKRNPESNSVVFPVSVGVVSYLEEALKLKPGAFDIDPNAVPLIPPQK